MQWTDEGMILSFRLYGETSAVVEIMTAHHGRHLGLMRGARSRKNRPLVQAGNRVSARWFARLDEQLGQWSLEMLDPHAGRLMETRLGLSGLNHLVDLLRLLPEREPNPALYEAARVLAASLETPLAAGALMVKMEMRLLDDLGFGLDLSECAATGASDDLIYVSPKSGRAVSRHGGAPWKDKLLPLPAFCLSGVTPDAQAVREGLKLTGFFLHRHLLEPRNLTDNPHREAFLRALALENEI